MRDFDPLEMIRVLDEHRVSYVLIGGMAGVTHGSSLVTTDLDICYERSPENLQRLAAALVALGARLRDADEDVPFILDAATLKAGDSFTFTTDAGNLDCLGTPAGTTGYEELNVNAATADLDPFSVRVASLEDLIRMKRAAGRPQDLIALEVLGALREETECHGRRRR